MPEKQDKTQQIHRVVLDTNILVSSILCARGNPAAIMKMISEGKIAPYYNAEIMSEYNRVLRYPKLGFTSIRIELHIKRISAKGILLEPEKSIFKMPDEDDRIFYDLHKAANAILITGNTKHYPKEDSIMKPAEFMEYINNA